MKSNYKPIGELVTRIDERNINGEATELIGVSIDIHASTPDEA